MKKKFRWPGFFLALLLGVGICSYTSHAAEDAKQIDIMFVHDTHSHLNAFATVEEGESRIMGGFAKLKTLIRKQKDENPNTLLLDAGDFSMGTLIQTVYEEEAAELRMLGELGIDVTTLGNHEFDYKAEGLANMLKSAVDSKDMLPAVTVCNVDWESMQVQGLTEDQQLLEDAFSKYGIKEYTIVDKGDVRIAVTGVFGKDSLACVPNCPLLFKDPVEAVQNTVEEIQANEDVDMIVCVSHGGVWEDEKKSEDEILAKSVPELDLIISGHTHTKLTEPIIHGDTVIASAGEYGKYMGKLSMIQKEDSGWDLAHYELITVDESIEPDEATQQKVDTLMAMVDEKYLKQFGYTKDQVLCTNEVQFADSSDTSMLHTEVNLGSIMADAYTYSVEQILGDHSVDVAVVPAGTIRDTYALGEITTEHVFNSFSLGIGADGIPGYPLIGVWLTGEELRTVAELDASISDLMTTARLYADGLYWHYNPNRMILNKVTDVYLSNGNEERIELDDEKLYYVVTDFYSSQMLGGVTSLSFGLLSIIPKFEDGTPIKDYEDAIIRNGDQELKAWAAIAGYMSSFEDTDGDGVGNVPEKYAKAEGRKVVEESKNILELLKNPNKYFFMIAGVTVLLLILITGVILLIRKTIKRIRKNR